MGERLDLSKEYGIVLEGGGAKGSYQIGAWKALREAGIKIRGISGASVGALNGALMCMDDLERAEGIWQNISYSKVMDVEDALIDRVTKRKFKEINVKDLLDDLKRIVTDGGFDITPLKNLILETVDEEALRNSPRELFVTTYSVSDKQQLTVDVKTVPDGEVSDMLLASAYFMAFKNEELGGKRYRDGGRLNNVPVDILLDRDYRDIIVIRIYGLGYDTERKLTIPADVNLHHIAPRQYLGGTLEFDARRARRNMKLGYYDAKRLLEGLEGRRYYISAPGSEGCYFDRMMAEASLLKYYLEPDEAEKLSGYRLLTEVTFPKLSRELKLKPDWNYKDLYLAILEDQARRLKVERYRVYTVDELKEIIQEKLPPM